MITFHSNPGKLRKITFILAAAELILCDFIHCIDLANLRTLRNFYQILRFDWQHFATVSMCQNVQKFTHFLLYIFKLRRQL